jgi:hypothetical protein
MALRGLEVIKITSSYVKKLQTALEGPQHNDLALNIPTLGSCEEGEASKTLQALERR